MSDYFTMREARGRFIVQGMKGEMRASYATRSEAALDKVRLNSAFRLGKKSKSEVTIEFAGKSQ